MTKQDKNELDIAAARYAINRWPSLHYDEVERRIAQASYYQGAAQMANALNLTPKQIKTALSVLTGRQITPPPNRLRRTRTTKSFHNFDVYGLPCRETREAFFTELLTH